MFVLAVFLKLDMYLRIGVVTWQMKIGIMEPEETDVVREWAINTSPWQRIRGATIEKLLEGMFNIVTMPILFSNMYGQLDFLVS